MPSSTSSSNAASRAPKLPAARVWALALAIFLVLAGGSEALWRGLGHRPAVEDELALWATQREALAQSDAPLALVGASRLQLAFDLEVWRELHPEWEPFMLAVKGKSPMSVLEDLADDETFRGVAVVSFSEEMLEPWRWEDQAAHVDYYHNEFKIGAQIERHLKTFAEKHLVTLAYAVNPERTVSTLVEDGHLPEPIPLRMLADRSRKAEFWVLGDELDDYRRKKETRMRKGLEKSPPGPVEAWHDQIPRVRELVDRIEARGGKVVFVRMPVQGAYLQIAHEVYPRDKYWDVFARRVGAPTVYFEDIKTLADVPCPDASHVGAKDRARVTRALITEFERLSIVRGR